MSTVFDINKYWIYTGVFIFFILFVVFLKPILMPFVMGIAFAYLMDPVVDKLEEKKLSRTAGVTIVFVVMALVFLIGLILILPVLGTQTFRFVHRLPDYLALLQNNIVPSVEQSFGITIPPIDIEKIKAILAENWQQAGGVLTHIIKQATASTMSIVATIANLILIPVVSFYMLRDWDHMVAAVKESVPREIEPTALGLVAECDEVLSAFIRGQLLVMVALGIVYSIGLSVIGLDLALLIGMMAGLASVVPYLGSIVGIFSATLAAYLQFGEIMPLVYVAIVFGIGQLLEGMFLTPVLVGDKIGLHPVAVIFAIMAGGQLAGFVGVLVALPAAAVMMVFVRHFHAQYKTSDLYLKAADEE